MNNPLDKLIVETNADDISLELLASTLQNFVKFTKQGEVIFDASFYKLPEWKKIVVYLLSRKVISIKKLVEPFDEAASPKEISEITGVSQKAVSRDLSIKLKPVTKNENSRYKIPNYSIHRCAEMLK